MKKVITVLSFVVLSFVTIECYAQKEVGDLSVQLFSFVSKLNNQIDSFFIKEKAESLYRNLGYFKNDLNRYLVIRKEILDYLIKYDYKVSANENNLKQKVSKLQTQISKLSERLEAIKPEVGEKLSSDVEKIIDDIFKTTLRNRIHFVTELGKLLEGRSINIKNLKAQNVKIYNELVDSIEMINIVREKLKTKFSLALK